MKSEAAVRYTYYGSKRYLGMGGECFLDFCGVDVLFFYLKLM